MIFSIKENVENMKIQAEFKFPYSYGYERGAHANDGHGPRLNRGRI